MGKSRRDVFVVNVDEAGGWDAVADALDRRVAAEWGRSRCLVLAEVRSGAYVQLFLSPFEGVLAEVRADRFATSSATLDPGVAVWMLAAGWQPPSGSWGDDRPNWWRTWLVPVPFGAVCAEVVGVLRDGFSLPVSADLELEIFDGAGPDLVDVWYQELR